jgi:glycerophosphoryl diester phosphodiesterase|eukprot:scaffold2048_cov204-Alexandrium_tamarense.AAC.39
MVKFGRHVDFFVANELHSSRQLYVVPYKEIQRKTCIDLKPEAPPPPPPTSPPLSPRGEDHHEHHPWNDNLLDSPGVVRSHNAVTLTNVTGAELANAVRQMLISSRPHPSTCQFSTEHTTTDDGPISGDEKDDYEQDTAADAHFFANRFQTEFRIALKRASVDFDRAMKLFWSEVFESITNKSDNSNMTDQEKKEREVEDEAIRGALPDAALQMYVNSVPNEQAQELFSFLKDIHATALINAEALRKLVKKFDKMHRHRNQEYRLSSTLLPEVYASNFTVGLASLEAGLTLLRVLLGNEEDEAPDDDPTAINIENKRLKRLATMDDDLRDVAVLSGGYFGNKKDIDKELVNKRKEELMWLRNMVESIDPVYIPFLVAHRGFHSIHDRSDVRPLENSLMAYEAAWTNGLHLCECDIALTKDERIILAHDENFARLGMDPTSPLCNRTVRDLTFKELMNCPLKSGARPPLLFDVLRSAVAIGGDAKMIVEIKAGNTEAGSALARMFVRHPQLMEHVAVVMSFDVFIMHKLRMEMAAVFEDMHMQQISEDHSPTKTHENVDAHPLMTNVRSNIALGSTLSTSPHLQPSMLSHNRIPSHNRLPSMLGGHHRLDSRDHFGLGLSMTNLAEAVDLSTTSSTSFLPIHKAHSRGASRSNLSSLFEQPHSHEQQLPEKELPPMSSHANNQIKSFPKLLLITVAETPKTDYELFVDINNPKMLSKLDGWLRGGDGGMLDGVYMQFQKSMLETEGSEAMRTLASRYDVGIWGANPKPDDWETFHRLVTECHVSYVNSGLPKHFRKKVTRSMSATNIAALG